MSSNGLKVTVEDAKCVQANAFVQSGIFQEFIFKEESATFRINLNVLLVIYFTIQLANNEKKSLKISLGEIFLLQRILSSF